MSTNFWRPLLKVIVTASGAPREVLKIFNGRMLQILCTTYQNLHQYPVHFLKREHSDQRNLRDLHHYCVSGMHKWCKIKFHVTGGKKPVMSNFIYRNQFF